MPDFLKFDETLHPMVSSIITKLVGNRFTYDKLVVTATGKFYFFETPDHKYHGLVLKKADSIRQKNYFNTELRNLLSLKNKMLVGIYKVPELVFFDEQNYIMVQQRIYGLNALEAIKSGRKDVKNVLFDAIGWAKKLTNGPSKVVPFESTITCHKFVNRIQYAKSNESSNRYHLIEKLLFSMWTEYLFESPTGTISGDFSPVHLFYASQGEIFGIDFNAGHMGSFIEEVGLFLGNAYFHFSCSGIDMKRACDELKTVLNKVKNVNALIPFIAYSYFTKALLEKDDMRKRLLLATQRLMEAPQFDVDFLIF